MASSFKPGDSICVHVDKNAPSVVDQVCIGCTVATMQTAAKVQHENLLLNEMSHWRVSFQERESVGTVKLDSSKDLLVFPLCAKYCMNQMLSTMWHNSGLFQGS